MLFFAVYDVRQKEDTLSAVHMAMADEDWAGAEKLLMEYLHHELDMENSWNAWLLLIDVSMTAQLHDEIVLGYLSDMLVDYGNDNAKKKYILFQVARIKERQNNEQEAIDALEKYANLRNLTTSEAFTAYKKLMHMYFRQGNFSGAEDVLHNCLALNISEPDTAYCLYNLAEIYAGKGSFETAHEFLTQLEHLTISDYEQSQVFFLHADILEQQRKYKEALAFFTLALDHYGNRAVVQERITALEKLVKKK